MNKNNMKKIARKLVNITIEKHNNNLLGREKMSSFINNILSIQITNKERNYIMYMYSRYLAKEGYEITRDINKFDIIDYNSEEYQIYINNI